MAQWEKSGTFCPICNANLYGYFVLENGNTLTEERYVCQECANYAYSNVAGKRETRVGLIKWEWDRKTSRIEFNRIQQEIEAVVKRLKE